MAFTNLTRLVVFAPLLLTACASDNTKTASSCPQTVVVRELDRMSDYGTETPEPQNLLAHAEITGLGNKKCTFDEDGVNLHFDLAMKAERGPRLQGDSINFPFFVAIVRPDHTILTKKRLAAAFTFHGQGASAEPTENLHILLPSPANTEGTQILIGFQLSHDQLDATRKNEDAAIEKMTEAPKKSELPQ